MIVEGLCTTRNVDGSLNVAPMGPIVDEAQTTFLFRPFQTSTTFKNLQRTRQGVFHIVDDVLLIAQAAIGAEMTAPATFATRSITGEVLQNCCRWFEFEVTLIDDSQLRSEIQTRVLYAGRNRDFWGFNRAKHAVLEAAILSTRLHLLSHEEVDLQFSLLRSAVEKTGGQAEIQAFQLLERFRN